MAKMLDPTEVTFALRGSHSSVSDEWFNGEPWMLESGVDFNGKPESFRTRLYSIAGARGLSARSRVLPDGNIIFSSYTPSPEEQERKAAAVAKRRETLAANAAAGKVRKSRKTSS